MKINSKDDIIEYFKNGYKKKFSIGVENEKFLFDINSKSRANYKQVKNVLDFLKKFGWKEISEDNNLIGLNNNKQSITLEPGNQIELSGGLCENVHQVCAESFKFQKQLDEACAYLGLETLSIGYDPITALQNSPNNPKKRYKVMTKEMPKKGKLSLELNLLPIVVFPVAIKPTKKIFLVFDFLYKFISFNRYLFYARF